MDEKKRVVVTGATGMIGRVRWCESAPGGAATILRSCC